jgi:hypothetical protein
MSFPHASLLNNRRWFQEHPADLLIFNALLNYAFVVVVVVVVAAAAAVGIVAVVERSGGFAGNLIVSVWEFRLRHSKACSRLRIRYVT